MPRQRKQSNPFDLAAEFVAPVVVLVALLMFFAPAIMHTIFGLFVFLAVAVLCGIVAVALFFVVRMVIRRRQEQAEFGARSPKPRETVWNSEAIRNYPQSELERYGPKPVQEQNLQERLRAIDWFQFEKVVSAIYEVRGCKVQRLGGAKPDGGIDLIVEMGSERLVVQCKHWKKWSVGIRHIRELLGTLKDANIDKGVLVTLRGCTDEATALARKHGIDIVEETQLVELMRNTDGSLNKRIGVILNDDKKLCPRCDRPLVMRTAKKGRNPGEQFWGCTNYPRCHYILRNA